MTNAEIVCRPEHLIQARPVEGRLRLILRWGRFAFSSLRSGDFDFVANALRAQWSLVRLVATDVFARSERVECNICGWAGQSFYPNTGPGYDDYQVTCPGCRGLDRHRSLLAILASQTDFLRPGVRVIEVAPMRGFQALCQAQPGMDYTSFDLERYAMERGDITNMHYEDASADYFVCFHVLEHIPDEAKALSEIRRVLKPGGCAVLQVPIDWEQEATVEYDAPDPRDVGHVRRHGRDFGERIARSGFEVESVRACDVIRSDLCERFALSDEPIFLAKRPLD